MEGKGSKGEGKNQGNFHRNSTGCKRCNKHLVGLCRYLDDACGEMTVSHSNLAMECMTGIKSSGMPRSHLQHQSHEGDASFPDIRSLVIHAQGG